MGKRVSIPKPLLANTHPRSACTPNMNAEQIPGPMKTDVSCTKVDGKLSELNIFKLVGRRNTRNGRSVPRPNCPNGLERGPARNPETQSLPRMKKRVVLKLLLSHMKKKRKKRRRKKMKISFHPLLILFSNKHYYYYLFLDF